jgi:hypothetical protein
MFILKPKNRMQHLSPTHLKRKTTKSTRLFALMFFLCIAFSASAQNINNYIFSTNNTGSLALDMNSNTVDMNTGTTQVIAPNTASAGSGLFNVGFDFYFYGTRYTQVSVTSNGLLGLGAAVTAGGNSFLGGNNRFSISNANGMAGTAQGTSATGKVHYKLVGTAPNRCLVIEWLNMSATFASGTPDFTCQMRLYETTGAVEFVYGDAAIGAGGPQTWNIGISTTTAIYQTVNTATHTAVVNVNTANSYPTGTITDLNSAANGSRRVYSWIPTPTTSPSAINFTGVAFNAMTVNWTDNSADEVGFVLYESHDGGVTYNYITQTAANATSYNATGLIINTNYLWRVYALREALSTPLTGSQMTSATAPMLSGVYPVGNSAPTYQKLTQVAAALNSSVVNGNVVFEMQSDYDGTTGETFPITFNYFARTGVYSVTIRPAIGATNLVTSGDPGSAIPVITINGADSLTFDGRAGGVGSTIEWTFRNTRTVATVAPVFNFQNDATRDTLRYLRMESQNTTVANATIMFGTSTGTLGNSNNVITNNDIRDRSDVAGVPSSAINSAGTVAAPNNNNVITANTIRNFTLNGIRITSNSNNWTIGGTTAAAGNNIYQEAARSTAFTSIGVSAGNTFLIGYNNIYQTAGVNTSTMTGISVTGSGNGHTIRHNSIGGSNASRTGTAMYTTSATTSTAILVTAGTTSNTNVHNNTISNWGVVVTGTGGVAVGISVTGGNVNVGTLGGNTIGGAAVTGVPSDTVVTSYDNGWISISGGTTVIVENNLVSNASYYRAANDRNCGIYITGSTAPVIRNNTVRAMKGNNTSTNASTFVTMGMYCSVTNATIENNTIEDIYNFNSIAAGPAVKGIFFAATAGTLRNNRITNIRAGGTQTGANAPWVHGIYVSTGNPAIHNNFISVGMNTGGEARVNGITFNHTTNPGGAVNFNTVYVTGVTASGTNNSFAFNRLNTGLVTLRNNLFYNERTGGTGGHYAIGNTAGTPGTNWTSTTSDNNNFIASNTAAVGLWGATPSSIVQWRASSAGDLNTNINTPAILPATTLFVAPATGNLKINPAYYLTSSDLESKGVTIAGVTVDFENDVRPGPVGSVNGGGTLPDIGADEFDGTPQTLDVGVNTLVIPAVTGCRTNCEVVRVRLQNFSPIALNFATNPVTITASVTGPNAMAFPVITISSGTLPGSGTLDTAVSVCYDMTAVGTYTFSASAALTGDGNTANNNMAPVNITISGGTVSAAQSSVCNGNSTVLTASGFTTGGTIQWQDSPDGITWTNIIGATSSTYTAAPSDTTFYRAVICGLHNSTQDTVNIIVVTPPTTVNDTVCGSGTVTLSASGVGTLNWYTAPTAGTLVNTGTTYSPSVLATTTYYVEATSGSGSQNVGAPANTIGTGLQSTAPQWLLYTVLSPSVLQTVVVYPGAAGTLTLEERDGATGTVVSNSTTVTILAAQINTPVTVTLNWNLTPGNYRFYRAGTVSLYRNDAGATYPYTIPGVVSITGNSFNTAYYYWAYNWFVSAGCSSSRTPVTATVTPAPAISAMSGSSTACDGDSVTLAVASANTNYTYTWSPAAFLSTTTGDSTVSTPTSPANYTYYVDATDVSTGCATRDTVSFTINPNPTVIASVDVTPICSGTSVNLSAAQPPAAVQITNGNIVNTGTTYPAPYGQYYGGSRHQMLILASELTAAGMVSGNLSGLEFQVTNTSAAAPLMNFTITMGATTVPDLSAGFAAFTPVTVYTNASYAPVVGINTHTFSTPFFWDGVSNIIVETCFANYTTPPNTTFTNNAVMRQAATAFVSTAYNRYDNTANICGLAHLFTASQRPNIAFLQSFSSWNYAWTPSANVATPNAQNTVATPTVTTNFVVTVTDGTTGCTASDSILVTVNPSPMPMLGADTAICSNTVLTLDGSSGPYTYLWSDASTNQTLAVSTFGNYDVLVTDSVTGCTGADTILIGINFAPNFSLGSDAVICAGNSVAFSGPAGGYEYLWNTADTTQSITTGTAGNYVLTLTDTTNACFNSDTVALTVNPVPAVMLGSDTSICSASVPLTLNAPSGNYTYNWSDASSADSLNVNATGTYYVTVTDNITTCFDGDTIVVTVNSSPVVSLGNDTTFCSGSGPITLNATAGPYNYLWSDLSTGTSLTTNTTGMYDVTVTDSITGCATADSISVTVNASPVVNLGADTSLCGGSLTLDAQNTGSNYLWSTTATTQTITVSSTANYYVDVTGGNGCVSTDSIMVTINTPPTVTFTLQNTACSSDPAFAMNGAPAGGTYSGPGVTGNMFSPSAAGVGSFTITYNYTDANGCFGSVDELIVISACVGVDEPFIAAGMNLFPNPNNGSFTLTINDADYTEITMELVTIEGQVVYSDKASNVKGTYVKQLDLTTHANGIYFLRVTANGQSYMQKVVKQD